MEGPPAGHRSPEGRHRPARLRPARSADRVQEGIVRDVPGNDGADSGPRRQVPLEDRWGGGERRGAATPGNAAPRTPPAAAPAADVLLRLRPLPAPDGQ